MKKLMFAAALFAAGAAMAVESQIVGYNTKQSNAGFTFYIPQFEAIGSTGVNIQDIKLGEGATDWSDNIQIFDENSVVIATYYYATMGESGLDADGWINNDGDALADVTLDPGQAVLINTSAAINLTSAGQVANAATIITSVAGFNSIGNNSPVAIDIQDIKLGDGATDWADNIQFMDENSVVVETYYYATFGESGLEADGWINNDGDALMVKEIPAGTGMFLFTSNAGVSITVPAAL